MFVVEWKHPRLPNKQISKLQHATPNAYTSYKRNIINLVYWYIDLIRLQRVPGADVRLSEPILHLPGAFN